MITISSAMTSTSERMWLETKIVRPPSARCRSRSRSQRTPAGSSPFAGSSRMSTSGSPSRRGRQREALAHAERVPARRGAARRPGARRAEAPPRRAPPGMPASVASTRRWLRPERPGWNAVASRTAPTRRAGSSSSRNGRPRTVAEPELGRTRPSTARIVVVFPAPFGPRKPVTRAGSTRNERSSTASVSPNRLVSDSTSITATASHRPGACAGRRTRRRRCPARYRARAGRRGAG